MFNHPPRKAAIPVPLNPLPNRRSSINLPHPRDRKPPLTQGNQINPSHPGTPPQPPPPHFLLQNREQ